MTTRLTILEPPPIDVDAIRRGLTDAAYPHPAMLAGRYSAADGRAWDRLVDDAVAEVLPGARRQLADALARRLPWRSP